MSDHDKKDYCSECEKTTLNTFSNKGANKTCQVCGTEFKWDGRGGYWVVYNSDAQEQIIQDERR